MLTHHHAEPIRPKRVVILGAGGFVGGAIKARLSADNIPLLSLTRKELDLLYEGAAPRLAGFLEPTDSVVLVSAIAPAKTVPILVKNVRMVEAVCEALSSREISQLVYISSDAVYADDALPVTESSPVAPRSLHGMMHAARELMLANSTKAPLAILRPTLIYGAADPHNGYGPNRFRRQASKGEPISIFGDGEERRDHVAIEDVAEIARLVLVHRSRGVINVATGTSTSFGDVARMLAHEYGVTVVRQQRSGPSARPLHRFFDIVDCHKSFPSFCYTPLTEGIMKSR